MRRTLAFVLATALVALASVPARADERVLDRAASGSSSVADHDLRDEVPVEASAATSSLTVTLTGNVPDRGRDLTGMVMRATPVGGGTAVGAYMLPLTATTSQAVFPSLSPGDYTLAISDAPSRIDVPSGWISASGTWVSNETGVAPVVTLGAEPLSLGPVEVPEGGTITAQILDETGRYSAPVWITAFPAGASAQRWDTDISRAVGDFVVYGLNTSRYRLETSTNVNEITYWITRDDSGAPILSRDPLAPGMDVVLGETLDLGTLRLPVIFDDVVHGDSAAPAVLWMKENRLTTGYGDGTFRPLSNVNRDATAAFFYRLAGRPAFTPPAVSPFADVPKDSEFYREITWLASTGITRGWEDGTFRPLEPVARDAMAVFLYRYVERFGGFEERDLSPASFITPTAPVFVDVPPGTQFYREIAWARATELAMGWSDGTYRPRDAIERQAMAWFLYRYDRES